MSLENNKRRVEILKQLDLLQGKLSRLPINDEHRATEAEIKRFQEEFKSLPPLQVFAGDIYLNKKTVYESERYRLRFFKGKYWLYDDTECITDRIEFDSKGEPVSAKVCVRNSLNPEGVEYLYHFRIDELIPEKPKGIPYDFKSNANVWNCPQCGNENPNEYEFCYVCRIFPRPKEVLTIKQ